MLCFVVKQNIETVFFQVNSLLMGRCQQIRSAIRMIIDEARKAQARRDRKATGGDRWKILQLQPTQPTAGQISIHRVKKVKVAHTRLPIVWFRSWYRFYSSQPAGGGSHELSDRLPLLFARPAVTPATHKRAATSFAACWTEAQWVWTVCLRLLPDSVAAAIWTRALLSLSPAR